MTRWLVLYGEDYGRMAFLQEFLLCTPPKVLAHSTWNLQVANENCTVPDVKLLPLPEEEFQKGPVKELGAFDDFRVRILPVLGVWSLNIALRLLSPELLDTGPIPAIFGLNITTYIICDLAGKPINNPLPVKYRKKIYDKVSQTTQSFVLR